MNIENINLKKTRVFKNYFFILVLSLFIFSCKGPDGKFKIPGSDARKFPDDPKLRVKKNLAVLPIFWMVFTLLLDLPK